MKMNIGMMKHFKALNMKEANALFIEVDQAKKSTDILYTAMEELFTRTQISDLIQDFYDVGTVKEVYEIFGGYVNRSFGILVEKDGDVHEYFVRKYKKGIDEKEISFEHKLISCAKDNGLEMAAGLHPTTDGATFKKLTIESDNGPEDWYYAVYEFLAGEDKYTWIENRLTDGEYASAAKVLASLHNATRNFDPAGLERLEPKILELIPGLIAPFKEFARTPDLEMNLFHKFYKQNLAEILEVFDRTPKYFTDGARKEMPIIPIHCDIHPGNLKYTNDEAVGIFDFDWAKTDYRLFDVAEALVYFCSSWEPSTDGDLRMDKCKIFLQAYQDQCKKMNQLSPLSPLEIEMLPHMVAMANLYLINWDVQAFYADTTVNVYEYVAYLQHNFWLMQYIEKHKDELAVIAKEIM